MIREENSIFNKLQNIKKTLINSENIGSETCNELNLQVEKLNIINKKSNSIYDKLLLSRDKINRITLSMPSFDIKLPYIKYTNTIDNNNIIHNESNLDEMDEISYRLKILKNMANNMNNNIKTQDIIIDEILSNEQNSIKIISDTNNKIKKIL